MEEPKWVGAPIQASALTGTTLTADQQNALERRKQEEQYLLVRQRELATTQQMPAMHPLHHPASVPFTTPGHTAFGAPLHPTSGAVTHHVHTPQPVQIQTLPPLDSLRTGGSAVQPQSQQTAPQPVQLERPGQVGIPYGGSQPSRSFMSPWGAGPLGPLSPGIVQMSQLPTDAYPLYPEEPESPTFQTEPIANSSVETPAEISEHSAVPEQTFVEAGFESRKTSISEDQEALGEFSAPATAAIDEDTVQSPLELVYPVEEHSAAAASTARVAPWAQGKEELKKAPTFKEIQELEHKHAMERERRLATQRELSAQQQAQVAQMTSPSKQGLPTSSTWGSVAAKGWSAKTTQNTPSPSKKTMAQIQKEEEEERAKLTKPQEVGSPATPVRGYAGAAAATPSKVLASVYCLIN
jgi:PERQ amino acid-rich with GYF domain-containing protein